MKNLCSILAIFLATQLYAIEDIIRPNHPFIQYTGRINKDNPNHYLYAHVGISIKIKFKGTGVKAVIHDYTSGT